MKHLLIILISFFLLSSPVIGNSHKGETLYGWGKYPHYVWKGVGDKETHSVYKGDVKNGKPNGFGVMIFPDGSKYEGETKDGVIFGKGSYTNPVEGKYVGEFMEGQKHGKGTHTFPGGSKYVGGWKNGKYNGEGEFTFGKGNWEGNKYVGGWKDNKKHGLGKYTWSGGEKYVGEYKDDKEWNGTYYEKDGTILGKMVNGEQVKHNYETLYRWGENPPYVWKDFREKESQPKYQGVVKDGKPNGFGILTYSVGNTFVGEWKNGQIYNGTHNNKRGYILFKWVNGKRTY